jgi:hypothetical protein
LAMSGISVTGDSRSLSTRPVSVAPLIDRFSQDQAAGDILDIIRLCAWG